MSTATLLLTPWYLPHEIISWQSAVTLVYLGKVDVVATYDHVIRSPSTAIPAPAVVRLRRKLDGRRKGVKFSRVNVYLRDGFSCQYCRQQLPSAQLTYDHVVPRARGGRTTWENIVTACYACNSRKANRTPEQAEMPLARRPYKPHALPLPPLRLDGVKVPPQWRDFCAVTSEPQLRNAS